MSQLVPYHLYNGEQDDSLMFATMFDYQADEYKKPMVSTAAMNMLVFTSTEPKFCATLREVTS